MSGLYIPNIELPTCCAGCHFRDALMCEMSGSVPFNRRLDDCPLISVPDHGRLIDADALIRELEPTEDERHNGAALLLLVFLQILKDAPAIIPTDRSEALRIIDTKGKSNYNPKQRFIIPADKEDGA